MVKETSAAYQNLIGIALMTAGMASGAAADAVIKALSDQVDTRLIATIVGFGMAVTFATASWRQGIRISPKDLIHRTVLFRTVCEVLGVYLLVLALSVVTLAEVTALSQTVPLLVTLGAVLFMSESVRLGDWAALGFGLVGMVLIVQPVSERFDPLLLIAVASAIVLAARDLASRATPSSVSTMQLGFWGGGALGVSSLAMFLASGKTFPDFTTTVLIGFAAIVLLASATFYGITAAMRIGSVAVISPFRYTRLPFGILLGMIFFSESIDAIAALGSVIIVVSGLAIWWRELKSPA